MKKIIILLSVITLASCSLMPDNGKIENEEIERAEKTAKENIKKHTDQEIARAKGEISNAVASVISKADSTLTKQFSEVKKSLNTEAEKTKKELDGKISKIETEIKRATIIGFVGIVIGFSGLVLAFWVYRKRPRMGVNRVKEIINEEINSNNVIRNEIRKIADGQISFNRPQTGTYSQATIDRMIETFMRSKKFGDILKQYISSLLPTRNIAETTKKELPVTQPAKRPMYQIYAKESTNSMILSNIQDTYQKGKSIYKLTMSEPNASNAEVSVCIEQEEVKQRILKFDSQYLEPICSVIRSSNEPTEVIIKTTGTAERMGEDWKVIRPITVEIK